MKVRKGVGCFLQGIATFVVMVIITVFATETESPAIIHWGIGMAVLYGIWGRNWNGSKKVNQSEQSKSGEEPPPLNK